MHGSLAYTTGPGSVTAVHAAAPVARMGKNKPVSTKCKYRGGSHPWGKENCPAAHVRCKRCARVGHYASVCIKKEHKADTRAVQEDASSSAQDVTKNVFDCAYTVDDSSGYFMTTLHGTAGYWCYRNHPDKRCCATNAAQQQNSPSVQLWSCGHSWNGRCY